MDKLIINPSPSIPEIVLSLEEDIYYIRGTSRPEDVRAIYYPVIEWIKSLSERLLSGEITKYTKENPLRFQIDLYYFNSSSAKFLYDIFLELKHAQSGTCYLVVEWYYEEEDTDLLEAGKDIALLAEMEFKFIPKKGTSAE
ncbi:MAG TPA: DUF1987 domain-containing protein [Bacteroidales bacterium]|nr:DUF1987 domain-containing protein [Bacteroidales bacterium]